MITEEIKFELYKELDNQIKRDYPEFRPSITHKFIIMDDAGDKRFILNPSRDFIAFRIVQPALSTNNLTDAELTPIEVGDTYKWFYSEFLLDSTTSLTTSELANFLLNKFFNE